MSCTWLPKQSRAARRAFLRSYHRGRWPRRWPTAQVRCQDPWATSQAAASESSHENPQMWCSERVPGNSETQSCALSCWPVVRRYQVSYSRPSSADRRQRTSPSASPQVCVGLQSELRQFQNVSNRSRTPPASLRQGHTVCGTLAMSFRGGDVASLRPLFRSRRPWRLTPRLLLLSLVYSCVCCRVPPSLTYGGK